MGSNGKQELASAPYARSLVVIVPLAFGTGVVVIVVAIAVVPTPVLFELWRS
jgi:hypothetical protein